MQGLDALPRDEACEGPPVDPEHPAHPNSLEAPVVDQAPDRLGMHAEPVCDLAHAVEACGVDLEHTLNVTELCGVYMGRMAYRRYPYRPARPISSALPAPLGAREIDPGHDLNADRPRTRREDYQTCRR